MVSFTHLTNILLVKWYLACEAEISLLNVKIVHTEIHLPSTILGTPVG